jgi:hypothetical protein
MHACKALVLAVIAMKLMGVWGESRAAARPSTAPAEWGEAKDGLAVSLGLEGQAIAGEKLTVRIALRNNGAAAAKTGPAFCWLLLVQSKEKAFYSEKILLAGEKDWPDELPAGKAAEVVADLSKRSGYPFQRGLKVTGGYPAGEAGAANAQPLGGIAQLLSKGNVMGRCTVCLPVREPPIVLSSNALAIAVASADAPPRPRTPTGPNAKLIEQFMRSAFAARAAHERATQIGAQVLDEIVEALDDPGAPDFARAWLATTLVDLKDPKAIEPLLRLLGRGDPNITHVIAYHGAKLRNARLNEAILAKAQSGSDPTFTAWAARGMTTFGATSPDKLIPIALKSKDPRARAEIAKVLAANPQGGNLDSLLDLLADEHDLVRAGAAQAITEANKQSGKLVGAMIGALERSDESRRQTMCGLLVKLTAQSWAYDPKAPAPEKRKTIQAWQDWWAKAPRDHRPAGGN